ncbi:MAG: hypothetical protein RLY78_2679 [Pseudomonadota bacterium]
MHGPHHGHHTPMPTEVPVPPGSAAESLVIGTDFHDSWAETAAQPGLSALGQFLRCMALTPRWVERCMALRNRAVELVGLQNLGGLGHFDRSRPESGYRPGDRIGIFTLRSVTFEEAVFGIDDTHLDVRLSVHRHEPAAGRVQVTITTAVKIHNRLGRLYMIPVKPMHRIIAPTVLKAVALQPRPA